MKQPKKCWVWTARQRSRQGLHASPHGFHVQPGRWLVRHEWKRHRGYTRRALLTLRHGADEGTEKLRYQHRHSAHWIAA